MIFSPIQRSTLPQDIVLKLKDKGLKLAEGSLIDSDSRLRIDILIGLDHFWQLVKPNVCRVTEYLAGFYQAHGI